MVKAHVVGAGLAGSEAAWQLVSRGIPVVLHEMRPGKMTAAHQTGDFAELVCSNSLKSMADHSAPGLLKREMLALGSLVIKAGLDAKVPAGQALAVNREMFSKIIEQSLVNTGLVTIDRSEITTIPSEDELTRSGEIWILATGPLTSDALAAQIQELAGGEKRLHFYDAIAPVIDADSIDGEKGFMADRWEKGEDGGDYLNLPMNKDEYNAFIDAVIAAEKMPLHEFEDVKYFESCLPIEVMIERGRDTLRFGPMKPVGLTDPRTGRWPYANVQLRKENLDATMFSMVGFQTKMKWPEQKRVFALIPGLENAEYLRFGSVHRNTYIKSPVALEADLSFRKNRRVFLAGQISGVEGYTESAAMGLIAGRNGASILKGEQASLPPNDTMIGSLLNYVTVGPLGDYAPMNTNLGLLPAIAKVRGKGKKDRQEEKARNAWLSFDNWQSAQQSM
jgi:methylenetetrahydrofolate--tRNA-(uracil-5-)-methyltransferase